MTHGWVGGNEATSSHSGYSRMWEKRYDDEVCTLYFLPFRTSFFLSCSYLFMKYDVFIQNAKFFGGNRADQL